MKEPCSECPFRKNSLPGWLGPYANPLELVTIINNETHFACHLTMDSDDLEDADTSKYRYCRGALQFMIKNGKLPRDHKLAELRKLCKNDDISNIMDLPELLYHHDEKNRDEVIKKLLKQ
jgi:hypothetical protein